MQNRAKWYRSIKEKKYRMSAAAESSEPNQAKDVDDVTQLRAQNEALKEAVRAMREKFPYMEHNLRRVENFL